MDSRIKGNGMEYIIVYIVVGWIFAEVVTYVDRMVGNKTAVRQYLNLVFLYPVVICVAILAAKAKK